MARTRTAWYNQLLAPWGWGHSMTHQPCTHPLSGQTHTSLMLPAPDGSIEV